MKEMILNLFAYVENGEVVSVGAVTYRRKGSDAEKLAFLERTFTRDHARAKRYPLPEWCILVRPDGSIHRRSLSATTFMELMGTLQGAQILEPIFQDLKAPRSPLHLLTMIVDGVPRVDRQRLFEPSDWTKPL